MRMPPDSSMRRAISRSPDIGVDMPPEGMWILNVAYFPPRDFGRRSARPKPIPGDQHNLMVAEVSPIPEKCAWRKLKRLRSDMSNSEISGLKTTTGDPRLCQPEISRCDVLILCVQCQAAAVRMFLGFFGLGVLAFEVGEGHVQ